MEKALLEELYKQAEVIAKETAGKLTQYNKSITEVFYSNNPITINAEGFEGAENEKIKEIAEKFNQYQEQAIARSEYAPDDKVKQAQEMETIIIEGNRRIKKLYDDAIKGQKNPS